MLTGKRRNAIESHLNRLTPPAVERVNVTGNAIGPLGATSLANALRMNPALVECGYSVAGHRRPRRSESQRNLAIVHALQPLIVDTAAAVGAR